MLLIAELAYTFLTVECLRRKLFEADSHSACDMWLLYILSSYEHDNYVMKNEKVMVPSRNPDV